nr:3-phosphoshikimate 1-carboxyvinyltransferase [Sphaerochaetaceae bacterium]
MITLERANIRGEITIPSSKSQTIRALLIATFSKDISRIDNPLESSDTEACIEACRLLGAKIEFSQDRSYCTVDATCVGVKDKCFTIDTRNSGTTTYLIYGLLAASGARQIILTGDEQLNRRPILPLVNAYRDLGVEADLEGECPPVKLTGSLVGGKTSIECRTSQYLSSLLLALPLAKEDSVVDCPILYEKPYVRMTLAWLDRQNIDYKISEDLQHVEIKGGQSYKGFRAMVTGDFSSASFFFVMAAITNSSITVNGLDKDDVQGDKHILDILSQMGCKIDWNEYSVTVTGPEHLKGGTFDL